MLMGVAMRLRIFSGLSLEDDEFRPADVPADVVILAGDIAQGAQGLRWARRTFRQPIVYVLGNREYRDFDLGVIDLLKGEAQSLDIHLLDCGSVEICGVRFLGCTFWTDFDLFGPNKREVAMTMAEQWVEDFQFISDMGRPFTPQLARQRHLEEREWLTRQLAQARKSSPTVVVTHHAPHAGHLSPQHRTDTTSAAFVSNLPTLLGQATLWIHGCANGYLDYPVGHARIVANSNAQGPENDLYLQQAPFADDLVIELRVPRHAARADRTAHETYAKQAGRAVPAPDDSQSTSSGRFRS